MLRRRVVPEAAAGGRIAVFLAAVAAAFALASCASSDTVAELDTETYAVSVYALNGSALSAPTAVNTQSRAVVRAEATFDFDVAFDIDSTGKPEVITQRRVGMPLGTAGHEVGLQAPTGSFDAITDAPKDGWKLDSTLTTGVGQVVTMRVGASACVLNLTPYMYTKFVIDSLSLAQRRLWLTVLTDPNCGFRSLVPGRPKH